MKGGEKMLWCNCICAWQPVRVVHGDDHIRRLTPPVTVEELLKCHPHHFVCEPTSQGPLYHSGMLPFDMELEEGRIYLMLPLPRLLPHLATTPACPCFSQCPATLPYDLGKGEEGNHPNSNHNDYFAAPSADEFHQGGQFLVVAKSMRKLRLRVAQSKLVRSLLRLSKRVIPQRLLLLRFSFRKGGSTEEQPSASLAGKSVQYSCSRNRWRPGLECISEVELLTGLLNDRDSEFNYCR